jgi:hypothetical protein
MRMQLEQRELRLAGESDRPGSGESAPMPGHRGLRGLVRRWGGGAGPPGRPQPQAKVPLRATGCHLGGYLQVASLKVGLSELAASGPFLATEKAAPTRNLKVVPGPATVLHTAASAHCGRLRSGFLSLAGSAREAPC